MNGLSINSWKQKGANNNHYNCILIAKTSKWILVRACVRACVHECESVFVCVSVCMCVHDLMLKKFKKIISEDELFSFIGLVCVNVCWMCKQLVIIKEHEGEIGEFPSHGLGEPVPYGFQPLANGAAL